MKIMKVMNHKSIEIMKIIKTVEKERKVKKEYHLMSETIDISYRRRWGQGSRRGWCPVIGFAVRVAKVGDNK